jgi:integrase/recombinase XerD
MTKQKSISPLRQRMLEDMRMRKLRPTTQRGYLRAVEQLTRYLKRSPDTATAEELRQYQLHLVEAGATASRLNARTTLRTLEVLSLMSPLPEPERLPVVLSLKEVAELLACAPNLKARTALSVAYGAGCAARRSCGLKRPTSTPSAC